MYSKQRYKICICLVILEELESFQYIFSIILPKILDPIQRITKVRIVFSNPNILCFFFATKNSRTWGVKCEKLSLRKS